MADRIADHEAPTWLLANAERTADCWTWTGPRLRRYGGQGGDRAVVKRPGCNTRNTTRALWDEVRGTVPADLVVRHTCDNGMCVRPEHLLLGTHKQNSRDALDRGRLRPGGFPHAA